MSFSHTEIEITSVSCEADYSAVFTTSVQAYTQEPIDNLAIFNYDNANQILYVQDSD